MGVEKLQELPAHISSIHSPLWSEGVLKRIDGRRHLARSFPASSCTFKVMIRQNKGSYNDKGPGMREEGKQGPNQ